MLPIIVISLLVMLSLSRKGVRILGVTVNYNMTFEIHLREVVPKATWSLGVVRRAGKLFDCPMFQCICFVQLEYCAPCGCSRHSFIWVCWIVLFVVRKGCVSVSSVVWETEGRLVLCVCSRRFIIE